MQNLYIKTHITLINIHIYTKFKNMLHGLLNILTFIIIFPSSFFKAFKILPSLRPMTPKNEQEKESWEGK